MISRKSLLFFIDYSLFMNAKEIFDKLIIYDGLILIIEIILIGQPILLPIGLSYLVQEFFESRLKDYYLRTVEKMSVSLVENSSFSVLENPIQEIGGLNF